MLIFTDLIKTYTAVAPPYVAGIVSNLPPHRAGLPGAFYGVQISKVQSVFYSPFLCMKN